VVESYVGVFGQVLICDMMFMAVFGVNGFLDWRNRDLLRTSFRSFDG
jgi:hypothetical protein